MEDYTYLLSKQTTEDYYNENKLYFTYKQQGYLGIQQSKINGTFHVRYPTNSPLKAEKIDIIFSGKGMVQWNEGDKVNYAETKYFEYSSCVYNEKEEFLNYSDLPFEFMIPENIPSSILPIPSKLTNHLSKAKIYYSIKAIITKPKKNLLLKKSKKIIEIECPITKYVQQQEIENQESVMLMKKLDNNNEISILFDKTKFDQNYNNIINLPLSIIIKNDKEKEIIKNIKKIQISLKENYLLKVGNESHLVKNILFNEIINKEKISWVKNNDNKYLVNCKLYLYGKRIRNSVKTDLINVWHQINIDISLKGKRRKIRLFEKVIDIVNAIDEFNNDAKSEEECEIL